MQRSGLMKKILISLWLMLGSPFWLYADDPAQKFQGFNLEGYTDNGEKSWELNGETADILGSKIKISKVDADMYGEQKANLTAETGVIDQASGNIHLEKDVVITSERGTQMQTDSLDWNRNEDLVTTQDDVRITDQGLVVTGTGMKAQPGLKTAQIDEDVKVTAETESQNADERTVTITCDGPMVINQTESSAVFQDNVVAVRGDQTLKADRMEVYFDQEMNSIKEMICIGHVVIIQGENQSFAEKAVYNAAEQKLTLSGRPKLILLTEGTDGITAVGN